MTLRISLLIREFRRLSGSTITAHIGTLMSWETLSEGSDRKDLLSKLYGAVFSMAPPRKMPRRKAG
jgi:hypothetical protein